MYLQNDWKVFEKLKETENLQVINIECDPEIFFRRYKGPNFFFRDLKNGLYKTGGSTNRSFFNGLSGMYITLQKPDKVEILIIYDTSVRVLNELQLLTRIKKLLGVSIKVRIGVISDFEGVVREIMGFNRVVQPFGDFYFRNSRTLSSELV